MIIYAKYQRVVIWLDSWNCMRKILCYPEQSETTKEKINAIKGSFSSDSCTNKDHVIFQTDYYSSLFICTGNQQGNIPLNVFTELFSIPKLRVFCCGFLVAFDLFYSTDQLWIQSGQKVFCFVYYGFIQYEEIFI